MKILLLNPPLNIGVYNENGRLYYDRSYPPLGLGYVAALLEREGYAVSLYDFMDSSFEDVNEIIKVEKPDVVGISCNLTDFRWGAFKVAQITKQINPNIKVVLGGCHATNLYRQILANFPVDAIVRYEGEFTFLELIKTLEGGDSLEEVKGIAFRREKEIIKNTDRMPIADLDSLPFPSYHFFDFNRYTRYPSPLRFKGRKVSDLKSINMITSRGCPHNCHYCSVTAFWRRHVRARSVQNVADEMRMLNIKYGIEYFDFFDSVFTLNKERTIELCQEILSRKLDVCWGCVTRVDKVSKEMLKWMKKAGCLRISYGVESGSPTVLKSVNKKQTPAQISEAFRMTHEAGISAYILLMVGNPNETEQTIAETIDVMRTVKPDKIRTTLTAIYPGTELYETSRRIGYVDEKFWLSQKGAPIYAAENNIEQLKKWENKILFSYLLQKKEMLRLFTTILYQHVFKNFREMSRSLIPRLDKTMEKIDQILHLT